MMNILGLSHNPSLLNVIMNLHTVSYPLLGSQVVPVLVCFCDAGGKEEGEKWANNQQGALHLISQAFWSQGELGEVVCGERRIKDMVVDPHHDIRSI